MRFFFSLYKIYITKCELVMNNISLAICTVPVNGIEALISD